MVRLSPRRRNEEGAVALLVVACTMVLFIVAALVVDLGLARDVRRQSQIAADASALAAGNALYPDSYACTLSNPWGNKQTPCFADAVSEAKKYALDNLDVSAAQWATCPASSRPVGYSSPSGGTPCISFDTPVAATSKPGKVLVVVPTQTVKTGLGVVAGVSTISVSGSARAALSAGQAYTCGLCFLGSIDAGNADFTVSGGSIHVNGDITGGAIYAGPNSVFTSVGGAISVGGTVSGGQFSPAYQAAPNIADPFAGLVLPPSMTSLSTRTDPCASVAGGGGPGFYGPQDLPSSTCTLQPGLYVINGPWSMKNNSLLTSAAPGVTLYVRAGGALDFKNGNVDLTASTSGGLAGFAIVYDRNNTNDLGLQGNGATSITGKVYVPSSKLDFNGNSCFGFNGGPVVATGVIKANGDKSCVKITNSNDVTLPSVPGEISLDQ